MKYLKKDDGLIGRVIVCSRLGQTSDLETIVPFFEFSGSGGSVHALYISTDPYEFKNRLGAPYDKIIPITTRMGEFLPSGARKMFEMPPLYGCFFNAIDELGLGLYPAELLDTQRMCSSRKECFDTNVRGFSEYLFDIKRRRSRDRTLYSTPDYQPTSDYHSFTGNLHSHLFDRYVSPMISALQVPVDIRLFKGMKLSFREFFKDSPAAGYAERILWMVEHNHAKEYNAAINYYLSRIEDMHKAVHAERYEDAARIRDDLKEFSMQLEFS